MARDMEMEPMLDMFLFETGQLIEKLEQLILDNEQTGEFDLAAINEIFRIMHTIKGSSAMMMFNNIADLAHSIEDVFYILRESNPENVDYSKLTDIVLASIDFIKTEIDKIKDQSEADGNSSELISRIKEYLEGIKSANPKVVEIHKSRTKKTDEVKEQKYYIPQEKPENFEELKAYKILIKFEDGCQMENIRAFTIVRNIKEIQGVKDLAYVPEDILENDNSETIIKQEGFKILLTTSNNFEEIDKLLKNTAFLDDYQIEEVKYEEEIRNFRKPKEIILDDSEIILDNLENNQLSEKNQNGNNIKDTEMHDKEKSSEAHIQSVHAPQSIISVSVSKLDQLMDLVGELVISEAMVVENPDISGLVIENFRKAARQLTKITSELQDIVMSIRMVPLAVTFQKMNRIVRDMCKKLGKDVKLEIIGEETEVDKNIIEHIGDPLMHIIRNSLDHGIETTDERLQKGKSEKGKITLEAKNEGGDVWIIVKDNGRGLDKNKILKKAKENGLVNKPENEITDKEIYSFIFLPGFSTKENVTEFSGRGVGMDVVTKNIETVGGMVSVDSTFGEGTTVFIKIPLTLAIIDGMTIKVGESRYTISTTAIKESFRVSKESVIKDPDGNEIIMVRGEAYPVLRLHQLYKVNTAIEKLTEGIIIMVENDEKSICLFADCLIGQQQVVVKALPTYIKKVNGIAGCTLLGDGNISLILDIPSLMKFQ